MYHGRRDDYPTALERFGPAILWLLFTGCLVGIYVLGRHFL